jgi:tRNA A-37 threonylcarbamoyl transferase component Bud32/tetratricopeptide (TPR) repeat protein
MPRDITASAPAPPAPAIIGHRYVVERMLGRGGTGAVYAVFDKSKEVRLALKRLNSGANETLTAMFDREYRTLASLRHPCIVEAYDYAVDHDSAYYTMELVEGHELNTLAPLPWRTACSYMRDAASILGVLHAHRLVHRDLSPRNLLVTANGRLKLIDFGALTVFGKATEVAGTPPSIAPEAIRSGSLDQRSDLFSVGAFGYWLMTGSHAFPARNIDELPGLWQREPTPVSACVRVRNDPRLEVPPPEIDELLSLLLRIDPRERIASTSELIDRLNVIADLGPEDTSEAVQGYLQSKEFVGRVRELAKVDEALRAAQGGRGHAVLIEGDAGIGRSRFLQELALAARVRGALTLSGDAGSRRPYAIVQRLLTELHRELRDELRPHLEPHASLLGSLSPYGRASRSAAQEQSLAEARARLQNALIKIFVNLGRTRFIAILIDDLQQADEESFAFLTALAHSAAQSRLCLVATLNEHVRQELAATAAVLRSGAFTLRLEPLTAPETRQLLASVFGEVPYLDRLSERLHRSSEGNPAYCVELAQHLVQTGAARYLEGRWTLPMELSPESLPISRRAGLLSRLERLPRAALALARAISIPHQGSWTVELVAQAANVPDAAATELIAGLARQRIVRKRDDGFVFSHDVVRDKLYAELEPQLRREIHARVARALERKTATDDVALTLCACVHRLRAGELDVGFNGLKRALHLCAYGDPAQIGLHASAFEEIVALLRSSGQDDYALCGPLGMLAVAGYFADRRYALRYGEAAIETLHRVLELDRAATLAPLVGRRAALFIALGSAAIGLARRRARCLPVQDVVRILLFSASTLAGTAAICMDPNRAKRYAEAIAPLTALGADHAATLIYEFSALMELQGRDRPARCVAAFREMIARLEDPTPIRQLDEIVRSSYHAGVHLTLGVFAVRRDDREGLAIADKLERFSPLYAMSADHLRANYYAGQGDLGNARAARMRVEVHAVQLGSAWQVETWAPVDVINIATRMHDAGEMKRAMQELGRLRVEVPSLALQEQYARLSYLVLRGQYQQAIELFEELDDPPFQMNGWARTRGTIARAFNALGQHERARGLCLEALAGSDPEDRSYVVMNLNVEIELALAEAGLGRFTLAHAQLDKLLAAHAPNGSAVTLGSLHEARAAVALFERDFEAARAEVQRALGLYQSIAGASLVERARALSRRIARAALAPVGAGQSATSAHEASDLRARAQVLLGQLTVGPDTALGCLQVALELSTADEGFLVMAGSDEPAAYIGASAPDAALVTLICRTVFAPQTDEEATVVSGDVAERLELDPGAMGGKRYQVARLWSRGATEAIAALVLVGHERAPTVPDPEVLHLIGTRLAALSVSRQCDCAK